MCVCRYVRTYVCMYVCMYAYMYVCVHVYKKCMYIYVERERETERDQILNLEPTMLISNGVQLTTHVLNCSCKPSMIRTTLVREPVSDLLVQTRFQVACTLSSGE